MKMLTPEQVSGLLQISKAHVLTLARAGKLPAAKVGRFWRFPEKELLRWQSQNMNNIDEISRKVAEIMEGIE